MLVPLTISVWRFNTGLKKKRKKEWAKSNRKLKILYKCIAYWAFIWPFHQWWEAKSPGISPLICLSVCLSISLSVCLCPLPHSVSYLPIAIYTYTSSYIPIPLSLSIYTSLIPYCQHARFSDLMDRLAIFINFYRLVKTCEPITLQCDRHRETEAGKTYLDIALKWDLSSKIISKASYSLCI